MSNPYDTMLDACCKKHEEKATVRQASKAVLAGLFIAIGGMMLLLVKSDTGLGASVSAMMSGICFSVGLFAVFTCGGELFTGDCLMVIGLRERRYTLVDMTYTLMHVWVWNYVGAIVATWLFNACGLNAQLAEGVARVAEAKSSMPMTDLFARSVMCNFLVCMSVWISSQADSVGEKLVAAMLPVAAFVALGFEHSIANMFLYLVTDIDMAVERLLVCTAGNVIGGALLFGGLQTCAATRKEDA